MLIEEYPNAVSADLCERMIAAFERDPRRKPSLVVVGDQQVVHGGRSGTAIQDPAKDSPEWQKLLDELAPAFESTAKAYAGKYRGFTQLATLDDVYCTRPNIERVDPGQQFDWHADQSASTSGRVVAGLLYLRTITQGGYTEFELQQRRIQPEAGKIALFPPFWTHLHRGVSPVSEVKYVVSFFWSYVKPR
jgi:hypothetical protein